MMLPNPSSHQIEAVRYWKEGHNVVCSACAGAGKSTLIAHVCSSISERVIVLSYNKLLAEDTKLLLNNCSSAAECFTFHGLCSRFFGLTTDDEEMENVVNALEEGEFCSKALSTCTHLCIDECQDLKHLHVRLINVLFRGCQIFIVGDEAQMLYDYDTDDPGSLKYMESPMSYFDSPFEWKRVRLGVSYRISSRMARIANMYLPLEKEGIIGANPLNECVDVYDVSPNEWERIVIGTIQEYSHQDVVILVHKRSNNHHLTRMLNRISNMMGKNVPIHVHGSDGAAGSKQGYLRVMTYHASKGTQTRVAVILGASAACPCNPLHVALTRAQTKLVIVQDIHDPLMIDSTIQTLKGDGVVKHFCGYSTSPPLPPLVQRDSFVDLCAWKSHSRHKDACHMIVTESSQAIYPDSDNTWDDISCVVRLAACLRYEHERTGTCLRVQRTREARRIRRSQYGDVIRKGCQDRFFYKDDHEMLPHDLSSLFRTTCSSINKGGSSVSAWCTVACSLMSWGGYHHQMRQNLPVEKVDQSSFDSLVSRLYGLMQNQGVLAFDKHVFKEFQVGERNVIVHGRCAFASPSHIYEIVYDKKITKHQKLKCALLLSLFPSSVACCHILNLKDGSREIISLADRDAFARTMVSGF